MWPPAGDSVSSWLTEDDCARGKRSGMPTSLLPLGVLRSCFVGKAGRRGGREQGAPQGGNHRPGAPLPCTPPSPGQPWPDAQQPSGDFPWVQSGKSRTCTATSRPRSQGVFPQWIWWQMAGAEQQGPWPLVGRSWAPDDRPSPSPHQVLVSLLSGTWNTLPCIPAQAARPVTRSAPSKCQ